jgi:hypothetical protein
VLLTEGAYSPGYPGKGRVGVHNASAFIHHYLKTFYPKLKALPSFSSFFSSSYPKSTTIEGGPSWFNSTQRLPPRSMLWVSRHYRMHACWRDRRKRRGDTRLEGVWPWAASFFRLNSFEHVPWR